MLNKLNVFLKSEKVYFLFRQNRLTKLLLLTETDNPKYKPRL